MSPDMSPEQQRAIVDAAVRAVTTDHQITRDVESVRAAIDAYDELVDAVCQAVPNVSTLVAEALAHRRELARAHALAVESERFRAHIQRQP